MSENKTRTIMVLAEDADWLWHERVPRESMASAFTRIRRELETLREAETKRRFKEAEG